jgi:hypothetical protein
MKNSRVTIKRDMADGGPRQRNVLEMPSTLGIVDFSATLESKLQSRMTCKCGASEAKKSTFPGVREDLAARGERCADEIAEERMRGFGATLEFGVELAA